MFPVRRMRTQLQAAMDRADALEVIPPITDPLGRSWDQPDRRLILIDDTHALMTRDTFDALAEYSCSYPSGVYPGKMWKRHDGAFDARFLARGGKPIWMLMWFGNHADPTLCSNHSRLILLV